MARNPDDDDTLGPRATDAAGELSPEEEALPVVARLVVEIRSDGRRTIARGAMEDVASGERVAVAARGGSPLELALGMARSIFKAPALARTAFKAMLPGRRGTTSPKTKKGKR